jgi:hypothetical protein
MDEDAGVLELRERQLRNVPEELGWWPWTLFLLGLLENFFTDLSFRDVHCSQKSQSRFLGNLASPPHKNLFGNADTSSYQIISSKTQHPCLEVRGLSL